MTVKPPIEYRKPRTDLEVLVSRHTAEINNALKMLAHKRAVKAAAMRRYRAKKGKK